MSFSEDDISILLHDTKIALSCIYNFDKEMYYTLNVYVTCNINDNTIYWNIFCNIPFDIKLPFHPFTLYYNNIPNNMLQNGDTYIGGITKYSTKIIKLFELLVSSSDKIKLWNFYTNDKKFFDFHPELIRSSIIVKINN